ncbi:hypothetical protein QVH35_02015 [Candidatus Nitrosotenuis chungbukensis]|uniref:hypothetical protein n=1 Tax=Candidatus Nitrosotenuis chungbukensis TaxID=1353246 RepID=UPI002673319A|nr:hypothetical protein [Candidatus Nitrosotenuis chungbukensis]WKT58269.1 hypothetical protein QVH35_02015 [Candidatus Nitrosotenuis chungbukensis]
MSRQIPFSKRRLPTDKIFKISAMVAGSYVLVIIVLIVFQLSSESYPIWQREGLAFLTGSDWNAVEGRESFGAAPYILGTLVTASLAMIIGVPLSIGIAMFISQASEIFERSPFYFDRIACSSSKHNIRTVGNFCFQTGNA